MTELNKEDIFFIRVKNISVMSINLKKDGSCIKQDISKSPSAIKKFDPSSIFGNLGRQMPQLTMEEPYTCFQMTQERCACQFFSRSYFWNWLSVNKKGWHSRIWEEGVEEPPSNRVTRRTVYSHYDLYQVVARGQTWYLNWYVVNLSRWSEVSFHV